MSNIDYMKKLTKSLVNSNNSNEKIEEKLNEVLFYLDRVKNSTSHYIGNNQSVAQLYTGQKIVVDTRDISTSPSLMFEGVWEPEITKVWRTFVKKDSVVIDVGANFGYFGIIAGADLDNNTDNNLHFIEANPSLTPLIYKSLSINGLLKNSKICQKAVSFKSNKKVDLHILRDIWGSSSLNPADKLKTYTKVDFEVEDIVKVKTITIDDYCKTNSLTRVNLVKLDVEGHEVEAYKGMKNTIKNNPQLTVFLEFTINAYSDSEAFFKDIARDFDKVYAIKHISGELIELRKYEDLKSSAGNEDWAMLVAVNG